MQKSAAMVKPHHAHTRTRHISGTAPGPGLLIDIRKTDRAMLADDHNLCFYGFTSTVF